MSSKVKFHNNSLIITGITYNTATVLCFNRLTEVFCDIIMGDTNNVYHCQRDLSVSLT